MFGLGYQVILAGIHQLGASVSYYLQLFVWLCFEKHFGPGPLFSFFLLNNVLAFKKLYFKITHWCIFNIETQKIETASIQALLEFFLSVRKVHCQWFDEKEWRVII